MELIKVGEKLDGKYVDYILKDGDKEYKFYVVEVNPVVIYPECYVPGEVIQNDCRTCDKKDSCKSPRSMCINSYHNHPNGCPNFGAKDGCPPDMPMFDQVYDMSKPIYFIITDFNLLEHVRAMREAHPDWSNYQLFNVRYWQGTSISINEQVSYAWASDHPNLVLTNYIESMGVYFKGTLKQVGIDLIFREELEKARRITCAGEVFLDRLDEHDMEVGSFTRNGYSVRALRKKAKK